MLENASENENLNLENDSCIIEHESCTYLHRLNFKKKRKYIELRAPECERAWGLVVGVHGGTLSAGFDPVSHTP
jgi:hypothetical protein